MQQAGAARLGEELGAEADQPAGGDEVVHPHPAGAVVDHLLQAALAQGEQLGDDADVLLRHVDREPLDRLVDRAVPAARDDLRLADRELEALAAHQLDEHGELELPRPCTSQVSGFSVSRTLIETLPIVSAWRRSLIWRAVSFSPSRPASGEVFWPMVTRATARRR